MNRYFGEKTILLAKKIKENRPLIHCITNYVTVNDCANALLAVSAAPVMAHDIRETAEITARAKALVCNFGATEYMEAMFKSAEKAKEIGIPLVIDPVGAGGSSFRRKYINEMIDMFEPACIRGNMSEIKSLLIGDSTAGGVDVSEKDLVCEDRLSEIAKLLREFAAEKKCIVIASGEVDVVASKDAVYGVYNGDAMMPRVTGSGCMSSALQGAFLSQENSVESAVSACVYMALAGEAAAKKIYKKFEGPALGSFRSLLIDELSLLTTEEIASGTKVKRIY